MASHSHSKKRSRTESTDSQPTNEIEAADNSAPSTTETESVPDIEMETAKEVVNQPKPSVIYAKITGDWMKFITDINSALSAPATAVMHGDSVSLQVKHPEDHDRLTEYLRLQKIQFSAPPPKSMRPRKVVLRGLPPTTNTVDIAIELEKIGYTVTNTVSMRNRVTKELLNLFLIDVTPIDNFEAIFDIKYFMHLKVKFTRFRATRAKMCHTCQRYGHHSNICNFAPRCVKCGGDHASSGCDKPRTDPAKCANCRGSHTANYPGCPQNPKNRFPPRKRNKSAPRNREKVPADSTEARGTNDPPLVETGPHESAPERNRRKPEKTKPRSYAAAVADDLDPPPASSDPPIGSQASKPSASDLLSVYSEIKALCSVFNIADILALLKQLKTNLQQASTTEEKLTAIMAAIFNFFGTSVDNGEGAT